MYEKMTALFKELKETYNLKQIPQKVLDDYLNVLYVKLTGAITEIGGSPYQEFNCMRDLGPLLAKETLTEAEENQKTVIQNQMKQNEETVVRQHEAIAYYLTLIEEVKYLNI